MATKYSNEDIVRFLGHNLADLVEAGNPIARDIYNQLTDITNEKEEQKMKIPFSGAIKLTPLEAIADAAAFTLAVGGADVGENADGTYYVGEGDDKEHDRFYQED